MTSDDTSGSPWGESSYAYLKFTEPGTSVSIEPVSAGTIANGGGFQSAVSGKRYIRLSTQTGDYDAKGAGSNLTAGMEAKGALWLSGNINDTTDSTTKGYGKAFTDSSYTYGLPASVKAFAYFSSLSSGTPSYNGFGIASISRAATGGYLVTLSDSQVTSAYTVVTGIYGEPGSLAYDAYWGSKIGVKVISATQFQISTTRSNNLDKIDPQAIYVAVLWN